MGKPTKNAIVMEAPTKEEIDKVINIMLEKKGKYASPDERDRLLAEIGFRCGQVKVYEGVKAVKQEGRLSAFKEIEKNSNTLSLTGGADGMLDGVEECRVIREKDFQKMFAEAQIRKVGK